MERAISENEKIRRAEEIYNRRREQTVRVPTSKVNKSKSDKKSFSRAQKVILQVCICILIYVSLYMVQNSNYIFSENVINKAQDILYYDIDFPSKISGFIDYVKNVIDNKAGNNVGRGLCSRRKRRKQHDTKQYNSK